MNHKSNYIQKKIVFCGSFQEKLLLNEDIKWDILAAEREKGKKLPDALQTFIVRG